MSFSMECKIFPAFGYLEVSKAFVGGFCRIENAKEVKLTSNRKIIYQVLDSFVI